MRDSLAAERADHQRRQRVAVPAPIAQRLGEELRGLMQTEADDWWSLDLCQRGEYGPELKEWERTEVEARLATLRRSGR